MIILKCDKCGEECELEGGLEGYVDHRYEEVHYPQGWFEHGDGLYCPKHIKRLVPQTYTIIDK